MLQPRGKEGCNLPPALGCARLLSFAALRIASEIEKLATKLRARRRASCEKIGPQGRLVEINPGFTDSGTANWATYSGNWK